VKAVRLNDGKRRRRFAGGACFQSRPWPAGPEPSRSDTSQIKDLHGGWFDAGDYNKYPSSTARDVIVLLRAYDENPTAFRDDTGIAESGNGVPDIQMGLGRIVIPRKQESIISSIPYRIPAFAGMTKNWPGSRPVTL
jgi:hypothetical protein